MKTFKNYLNKIENFNESEKGYSRKGDMFSILDALSCDEDGNIPDDVKEDESTLDDAWNLLNSSQKADALQSYLIQGKFSKERSDYSKAMEKYYKTI